VTSPGPTAKNRRLQQIHQIRRDQYELQERLTDVVRALILIEEQFAGRLEADRRPTDAGDARQRVDVLRSYLGKLDAVGR